MLYKFTVVIIFLMVSSSVTSQEATDVVLPEKYEFYAIKKDTIKVETPEMLHEFPYRFPSFDFENKHFAGLDERTNTINIYKLGSFEVSNSIQLDAAGPNAIQANMVGSLWYHNLDSIFILQNIPNRLLLVNSSGEIAWQKDLSDIFKNNDKIRGLMAFGLFDKITLYFTEGKAYFGLRQNQAQQDFLNPIIGYYDFIKDDIFTLDIHYPEFYTENDNVGSYHFPNITYYDNSIIIVFPYSPEIFIYDLEGHLQTHVLKPEQFKIGKAPEPGQSNRSHLLSNPLYKGVIPVDRGQYFVQYSQDQTPLDATRKSYQSTIIYSGDFKKYFMLNKNLVPISFGGEYFYYPLLPERSDIQLLERYQIEISGD